jgi:hypothetical protein
MLTVIHTEDKFEVYVDGTHIQSVAAAFTLSAGGDTLYYGRLVEGGFDFSGKIAEAELLNEILSDAAITARYEAKLVTPEDTATGGIKVDTGLITLLPGETAELPVKALGETVLKLTVVGDAAALKDGTLTATAVGETLIYAVSEDGRYLGGVVVRVVESIPEDTTEEDTDPPVEPGTDPDPDTGDATDPATNPPADEEPDPDTDPVTQPAETDPPKKKGCGSSLGVWALWLVVGPGSAWVIGTKRRNA